MHGVLAIRWWRLVRLALLAAYAVGLGAYLTLGDVSSSLDDPAPDPVRFAALAAVGITVLVIVSRRHALWILPAATIGFAVVYCTWFFDGQTGGSMDDIGLDPGWGAAGSLFLGWPYAALLVFTPAFVRSLRRTPQAMPGGAARLDENCSTTDTRA